MAGKAAASHNSAARRCPWSIHLDVWGGVEGGVGSVLQGATEVESILLQKERCVGRQPVISGSAFAQQCTQRGIVQSWEQDGDEY